MRFAEGQNLLIYPPDPPAEAQAEAAVQAAPPPVILFLHGMGERGEGPAELPETARWGLPKFRAERRRLLETPFPFLVAAPQCPKTNTWCDETMLLALGHLLDGPITERGDAQRLYLTGFSMGGIGAFCLALRHPRRFAALASVCGACTTAESLPRLSHLPLWVAYGEDDEIGELTAGSREIVARLKTHGWLVEKPYRLGHKGGLGPHVRTGDAAYAEAGLYDWLLSHRLPG
ncbi:MAG TPA: alpha/beta fold hydrolase [Rhodospirillales bacterium]|nr:alpha/beta fold hydrolase [Rhodospirillales bacterium]